MSTNNPYIGLRTYDEHHRQNFWGRDEDTTRLADSIIENTSTLIYGCSGCGKSSMINAGLIPTLEHYEKFGVEYRYKHIKIKPHDCIKGYVWSAVSDQIDNFVINDREIKGYSMTGEEIESKDFGKRSLWEKLNLITYRDPDGNPISFLIIIDQFEEIFQMNLNLKEIRNIFNIYELMCGYYKQTSIDKILDKTIADLDIIKKYAYKKPENFHRFVITIRQDFLYELEAQATSYPVLHQNRVHISPLNEEQAYQVITSSKKADGTPWFRREQAISFIKQLTGIEDFEIDGNPEIQVDPMMLSLYLQELCSPGLREWNDESVPPAENIIRDFYFENMKIDGVEALEAALISDDGRFRKDILLQEAEKKIDYKILSRLNDHGILTFRKKSNDSTWVELRHDKLCEYAKMHIETSLTKNNNIRNHSPLTFLTVHGRQSHENSYHIPEELPQHLSFLHFIKGGILNAPDINLDFSGILQNSPSAHHCELRMSVMDKFDEGCYTEDGIREVSIKIVRGLIYDICFFGENRKPHTLYFGISGITFYYDQKGRVVLKDYYQMKDSDRESYTRERVVTEDGYTSILYLYENDEHECPYRTIYLKLDKGMSIIDCAGSPKQDSFPYTLLGLFKCRHKDGNFGYLSEYDRFGCEICRTFVNEDFTESSIDFGYSKVRFERHPNDTIKTISYYYNDEKFSIGDIHKREYLYDSSVNTKIVGERAYDIDDKLIVQDGGVREPKFSHEKNLIFVRNGKEAENPYQIIILNSRSQYECVLNYNSEYNLSDPHFKYRHYREDGQLDIIYDVTTDDSEHIQISGLRIFKYDDSGRVSEEISYKSGSSQAIVTNHGNGTATSFRISKESGNSLWMMFNINNRSASYSSMIYKALDDAESIVRKYLKSAKIEFAEGFARICINGLYGYLDTLFKLTIKCEFKDAREFVKAGNLKFAIVLTDSKDGKWGTIDEQGSPLIKSEYDEIFDYNPCNDGLIKVRKNGKYGFIRIDGKDGGTGTEYDECDECFIQNSDNVVFVKVRNNGKSGTINNKGDVIIPLIYDEILDIDPYNEGLIKVKKDGKCGFIRADGKNGGTGVKYDKCDFITKNILEVFDIATGTRGWIDCNGNPASINSALNG